jgi:hypothetical protein
MDATPATALLKAVSDGSLNLVSASGLRSFTQIDEGHFA